ncbi:CPBP family intramembrane glutamic endopeptidase [Oceanobacillus chungangensis]|uniref:CPBP family intramembrane metalloprotease n=1 Tax=Oceanobacillus chungangensis TaxID=1229152 RepID=A0A3D8PRR9_9BACI|nr:type II CAAX endopeptidase family protein [Oceanobacillus chungangensis]RDW18830.1 CPBP family intramembrane metalloprotease [Oceanobacillus chungangensis]
MTKRYWYVILAYIIMQYSVFLGAPLFYAILPVSGDEASIYWTVFSFILGLVIVLFLMKPDMQMRTERDASSAVMVITWSILGLFMAYFAQAFSVMLEIAIFGITPGSANTAQIMDISRAFPLFVIVPALIGPILEEIIFRKIIFGSFYKKMNFFFAALLSALIFGFIHQEPEHILIYASMGFVFAYLYVITKRIITPIIVHMAMNSLTIFAQYSLTPEQIQQQLDKLQLIIIGG